MSEGRTVMSQVQLVDCMQGWAMGLLIGFDERYWILRAIFRG